MIFSLMQAKNHVRMSLLIALVISIFTGCKVSEKMWVENMLSEMEAVWIEQDKAGGGQVGRDAAVTAIARKYFPPGMSKDAVLQLLSQMREDGYEIDESRFEGTKAWPGGELISPWKETANPNADAATIRNLQAYHSKLKGVSVFSVRKMYGRERIIVKKFVAIKINIPDETNAVAFVEAEIFAESI
ncbi:MAG: hypothetical protein ACK4F8_01655 [Aquabacterium sp.]